jgi:sRNA-binding protein
MTEHLTRAHLGHTVQWWCTVCQRETKHRVDAVSTSNPAGHISSCLEHGPKANAQGESKKQETARKQRERREQQAELFAPAKGIRP